MLRAWFTPLVVCFWCVTTGWLVVEKILPTFLPGSPPGYQALYASGNRLIPVAWTVLWDERPLGWATSESRRTVEGGLTVESLLHFDRLPIDEMLPAWTKNLLRPLLPQQQPLSLNARGRMSIDPKGNLRAFSSIVNLPGTSDRIFLSGSIEDGRVAILITARDIRYETTRHLPANLMIGDELSPQATMPGLYKGQRWTVPIYSPLRPGQSPIEVLHAMVTGEETIFWEDRLVHVDAVAYRDDPSSTHEPRCRLWVDRSGRVLKQEAAILGSKLVFLRRSDASAESLVTSQNTSQKESSPDKFELENNLGHLRNYSSD